MAKNDITCERGNLTLRVHSVHDKNVTIIGYEVTIFKERIQIFQTKATLEQVHALVCLFTFSELPQVGQLQLLREQAKPITSGILTSLGF
jgi:hypothetical protein